VAIAAEKRSVTAGFERKLGDLGPALRAGPVALIHLPIAGIVLITHSCLFAPFHRSEIAQNYFNYAPIIADPAILSSMGLFFAYFHYFSANAGLAAFSLYSYKT
jgi:hypothetical protein